MCTVSLLTSAHWVDLLTLLIRRLFYVVFYYIYISKLTITVFLKPLEGFYLTGVPGIYD